MAHPADNRDPAGENGPGDDFLVEGPEVFERAPAPGDDEGIDPPQGFAVPVDVPNRPGDFLGSPLALDPDGMHGDPDAGEPAADGMKNVADGGPGPAGHHRDVSRVGGDGFFVFGLEQALPGQTLAHLLEGQFETAHSPGFEFADIELVLTPRLIDVHVSGGDDLHAVLGLNLRAAAADFHMTQRTSPRSSLRVQ